MILRLVVSLSAVQWASALSRGALVPTSRRTMEAMKASRPTGRRLRVAGVSAICMKRKGKSGMRPGMGGGGAGMNEATMEQQRQYSEYQKQRAASGMPSFDLYVKGPLSPQWYPCGSLGGDKQSKDLVEQYMGGLLSGFAKGGMDRGVATSVFSDKVKLTQGILEQYPQLKKQKNELKFGYKVTYEGLLEKKPESAQVTELLEEMTQNPLDKLKSSMGMG